MSIVLKFRDGAMKTSTASLLIAMGLVLASCSRPINVTEMAANFRDKVSADASVAAARRAMRPIPNEYGGDRPRPKAPAPGPVGPDGKPEAPEGALIPGGPVNPGPAATPTAAAPPVVYYYPAPVAAPAQ